MLSPKNQPERPYFPLKFIIMIAVAPSGLFLLGLFAGIGWGILFVAVLHLLFSLVPLSAKLARLLLGSKDYARMENMLEKTAKSRVYRITIVFSNAVLFAVVGILFRMNLRLQDFIK